MDWLLLFLPLYPAHTAPTRPIPLQRRAGKAPCRGRSLSPPCSSCLRKFSLLIFFFFLAIWILPTTPVHAQEPHCILYSAQRVPTRILHSRDIKLLKTVTFHHKDTPVCNKLGKLDECTPYANDSGAANGRLESKHHGAVPRSGWRGSMAKAAPVRPLRGAPSSAAWHVDGGLAERTWIYLLAAQTYSSEDLLKPKERSYIKIGAREKRRLSTSRLPQSFCFCRSTPGHLCRLR